MGNGNSAWNLESFIDALVVELDKARETLSFKAINNPLSYSVKDMSLDLQIFPTFDGNEVQFKTATTGEEGASTLAIKLSSITDRQVRETSKELPSQADIKLENMNVDDDTKRELRKIGVTSVNDLEKITNKNVDIEPVTKGKVNYSDLANMIQQHRRNEKPPKIKRTRLSKSGLTGATLTIDGKELSPDKKFKSVATLNGYAMDNVSQSQTQLVFSCSNEMLVPGENQMVIVTDPYSIIKMKVNNLD